MLFSAPCRVLTVTVSWIWYLQMFLLFKEKSVRKKAQYQRVPRLPNDKFWISFMLRFIYFAMFLLRTFIHIVVVEEIREVWCSDVVFHILDFYLKKNNTFCIVWSFPHWDTSNRKQQWHYPSVFIKEICLVVLIHSECKAWKCFHYFICNNKFVLQLFEVSCILKGNVVFLQPHSCSERRPEDASFWLLFPAQECLQELTGQ